MQRGACALCSNLSLPGVIFYHGLVDSSNAAKTVKTIAANAALVRFGIILYLINFIGDILAAWGIYITEAITERLL